MSLHNVLLVEDNPGDVYLTRKAFERLDPICHLDVVHTGDRALAFLHNEGSYIDAARPDLVVLDINLPRMNGHEVLAALQADPGLRNIPVVVLSSSDAVEDMRHAHELHALWYFVKPYDPDEYLSLGHAIAQLWRGKGAR